MPRLLGHFYYKSLIVQAYSHPLLFLVLPAQAVCQFTIREEPSCMADGIDSREKGENSIEEGIKMSPQAIKKRRRVIRVQEHFQWVFPMLVSIFFAFLITQIFGNAMIVKGDSMFPTYRQGDIIFINKISYRFQNPKRNDIIVFDINTLNTEDLDAKPHYTLSRVVGMPGETIQIKDGVLYIDGEEAKNSYVKDEILQAGVAKDAIKLKQNEYFVLGDNCNYSQDSRFANVGNIKKDAMLGKIVQR